MEAQVILDRANVLLQQKRYKDAEAQIRSALERDPQNDRALCMLSRCYLNTNQCDKAIDTLVQAIAIEPNTSYYFYLLGFCYYKKHENLPAITNLEKAIKLNPCGAEYFGLLAFVLIEETSFDEALEKANNGLALEPDNITSLNARATALNKLRKTGDAIETMNTALAKDPDNEVTHNSVGWNLLERGRNKDAQKHFMEALRINPNYSGARVGLKESLKSKIFLYRWLLQYSFWLRNKGKNSRVGVPIVFFLVFRAIIALSSANESTETVAWALGGVYIFIVIVSWTINSIANFVLLFHPVGKYSLSNSERWGAINSVLALASGIAIMALSGYTAGTVYKEGIIPVGMICVSLALPLGRIQYPIILSNKGWRAKYAVALVGLGLLILLFYAIIPSSALPLFIIYLIAFIAYNWTGARQE